MTAGSLPTGLGLNAGTGAITGTPTAAGTFNFTAQATSAGQNGTKALAITVNAAPVIVTTVSPMAGGTVGAAYSQTLTATGGDGVNYAWSVTAGSLPTGLLLNAGTGAITGTTTAAGTFNFTAQATSAGQSGTKALAITVGAAPVSIDTDYLLGGNVGVAYSDMIDASGGDGVTYAFSVTGGSLPPGVALAASTGALSGPPTTAGAWYFTVQVLSGGATASKTYVVAISTTAVGAFNMWTMNVSAGTSIPSAVVQTALTSALARWETVITGDLTDVTYPPGWWGSTVCSGHGQKLNGQSLDDMVVFINIAPIDGPGGTIGSAGPCVVRTTPPMVNTQFGRLTLDSDDLASLDATQLFSLIFHEIGHIVGIGSLWTTFTDFGLGTDLMSDFGGPDPRYEGAGGNGFFVGTLGGGSAAATKIPIETHGGSGTRDGHWDEGEFDTEMMTGYIEAAGVVQPISGMTIAAIGDLNYTVNPAAADAYAMPGCTPLCAPPAAAPPGLAGGFRLDDILREPIWGMLPDGRVIQWVRRR